MDFEKEKEENPLIDTIEGEEDAVTMAKRFGKNVLTFLNWGKTKLIWLLAVAFGITAVSSAGIFFILSSLNTGPQMNLYVPLNGNWTLNGSSLSEPIVINVPGSSYKALMNASIIGDPYYRFNDVNYRWVGVSNWTLTRSFFFSDSSVRGNLLLVMEGVDTAAKIYVNDILLGETSNMFVRYSFDVTNLVAHGRVNTIRVEIRDPVEYAKEKKDEYPYVIPSENVSSIYHSEEGRQYIRKAQCHFGWDWGPCLLPSGIWKSTGIYCYDEVRIEDIVFATAEVTYINISSLYDVKATADIYFRASSNYTATVTIQVAGAQSEKTLVVNAGENKVTLDISIVNAELWYPAGLGSQKLYEMATTVSTDGQAETKTHKVGLRTVELVTDDLGNGGESFYFRINGESVFVKGANFIPADSLEDRVTKEVLENLIDSAVKANMNALRVWGGGIYQHEDFYKLCDEKGVMVWQECMFACALYPRDDNFLDSSKEEVRHQVRRLAYHPSIILWSANNENEEFLRNIDEATYGSTWQFVVDYSTLYVDSLRTVIGESDPTRPFWPSSPSNGPKSEVPYTLTWGDPNDVERGDVHFYNYTMDCFDVSQMPSPRFASEYGFQSYPSLYSLKDIAETSDLNLNPGGLMDHRQHHPNGNNELEAQISQTFREPKATAKHTWFDNFVYLTQLKQATCIQAQTEHYLRGADSSVNTMGTLFWQLNDIWQAPSWSSIEYSGRWKPLQYFAQVFYDSILVSAFFDGTGKLNVVVSNFEAPKRTVQGFVYADLISWETGNSVYSMTPKNVDVGPYKSVVALSQPLSAILPANYSATDVVLTMSFKESSTQTRYSNWRILSSFHGVDLQKPNVQITYPDTPATSSANADSTITKIQVDVEADFVTPFFFLETSIPGKFSQNAFLLLPGVFSVEFVGDAPFRGDDFKSNLTWRSLYDTYAE